jgi:hypothetical protein
VGGEPVDVHAVSPIKEREGLTIAARDPPNQLVV